MSKFLKSLLSRLNDVLFQYQVNAGLILCAVEQGLPTEDEEETVEEVEEAEEESEDEQAEETEQEESSEAPDEVVIQIEGEEPEEEESQPAPQWVKDLRKNHRELQKEAKQLREQLAAATGSTQKPVLKAKPTLEACDYDTDVYEKELEDWHKAKRQVEEQEKEQKTQQEKQERQWQEKLGTYAKAKTELKVKDFDDAEEFIKDTLSVTQQGIILQGCKNPALVVYALGKNPKKAKQLAEIKDPVEYTFAIANLENQLKVTNKRTAPPPEKTVKGAGSISGTVDSQLDRLRAEAEKTGNYSKVIAYKNQLKAKGK